MLRQTGKGLVRTRPEIPLCSVARNTSIAVLEGEGKGVGGCGEGDGGNKNGGGECGNKEVNESVANSNVQSVSFAENFLILLLKSLSLSSVMHF